MNILDSKVDFTLGGHLVKTWRELLDFCEKVYEVMLGFNRAIKNRLVEEKIITRDNELLDAPSKTFALYVNMLLDNER